VTGRDEVAPRLTRFLLGTGRVTQASLDANAPLITSGLIDSVTLFNLALWIEETIGRPVNLSDIALPEDWDTLGAILAFVERQRKDPRSA
jgi:acyl carrier protein